MKIFALYLTKISLIYLKYVEFLLTENVIYYFISTNVTFLSYPRIFLFRKKLKWTSNYEIMIFFR